ncbi:prostaglandin reductase 2-like [Lineus longissimus]|uniref:prostaglandin reductase 2-like n=1 Tax=Lineus longissimus TaxID=88925 RepID=UPI002B4F139B
MPENYRVVLQSRPGVEGVPTKENFRHESCPYPGDDLNENEVLIKTLSLSMDAALRCCMNEDTGVYYLKPWALNEPVNGSGGVGVIVQSKSAKFEPGDLVVEWGGWPWQLFFTKLVDDNHPTWGGLTKVQKSLVGDRPSIMLSLLGLTGMTALIGIRQKGPIDKEAQQTFVVSGAAGGTGNIAGQVAKLDGCKNVIGICGSDDKCSYIKNKLGFNFAINYKTENVAERLKEACPSGIDIYFDNVGGEISNSVVKQMNPNSKIILCGQIAQYNIDVTYPPKLPDEIEAILKEKNITRDRFLVLEFASHFPAAMKELAGWLFMGKLKVRETKAEGLENAGNAFISLMSGGNVGKQICHVSNP